MAAIHAGLRVAVIQICLAVRAHISLHTLAFVFIRSRSHFTGAVIQAGTVLAQRMVTDLSLAVAASESGRTMALIVTAIILAATAAILAWFRLARRSSFQFTILAAVPRKAVTFVAESSRR